MIQTQNIEGICGETLGFIAGRWGTHFNLSLIGLLLERPILEARPKPHDHVDYGQIHIIHGLSA